MGTKERMKEKSRGRTTKRVRERNGKESERGNVGEENIEASETKDRENVRERVGQGENQTRRLKGERKRETVKTRVKLWKERQKMRDRMWENVGGKRERKRERMIEGNRQEDREEGKQTYE